MKFWNQKINQDNHLTATLSEYKNALERGYFDALDEYRLDNREWSDQEEVKLIISILKNNSTELENLGITFSKNLMQELHNSKPYGLHKIAHFISALDFLKTQKHVSPEEELGQLDTSKINVQVEVGMPVACLAKLGAVKCSSLDNNSKIFFISHLINALFSNRDKFGSISTMVLKVALDEWLSLVDTASLSFKEIVDADYKKFTTLKNECQSIENIKNNLTYFDQCIIIFSEKLNNNIGQIILENKDSHSALKFSWKQKLQKVTKLPLSIFTCLSLSRLAHILSDSCGFFVDEVNRDGLLNRRFLILDSVITWHFLIRTKKAGAPLNLRLGQLTKALGIQAHSLKQQGHRAAAHAVFTKAR